MCEIPKTAYFYWGAKVLPYLRYMSLYSFHKYNPSWKIVLFIPSKLGNNKTWKTFENKEEINTIDYFNRLKDFNVEVRNFDMESIGFSNDLPEVMKSDVIRLHLLSTVGGLWSDSDIIYFRLINKTLTMDENKAYFCYRRGGVSQEDIPKNGCLYHSIGFLLSPPNNMHFAKLFREAKKIVNTEEYQNFGSPFYDEVIDMGSKDIFNIDIDMVYPSRAVPGMWTQVSRSYINQIRRITIGWHFYGGHPVSGKYQNLITEDTYGQYDNIICWLLGKVNRNETV
jgi:hypothetical protein